MNAGRHRGRPLRRVTQAACRGRCPQRPVDACRVIVRADEDIRPYTRPSTSNVGADLCVRPRWPPHPRWSPSSVMASPCHLPPGRGKAKKRTKRLLLWCQGSSLVLFFVHAEHGPGLVKQVHHAAVVQNSVLVQPVLLPVAQLLLGQEPPVL